MSELTVSEYRLRPVYGKASVSVAYPNNAEHAARLVRGIRRMHPAFMGRVCELCDGWGSEKHSPWSDACRWCNGTGVLVADQPAPFSVVNQIIVAAGEGPIKCLQCDDTGFKDHAGWCVDECDHKPLDNTIATY